VPTSRSRDAPQGNSFARSRYGPSLAQPERPSTNKYGRSHRRLKRPKGGPQCKHCGPVPPVKVWPPPGGTCWAGLASNSTSGRRPFVFAVYGDGRLADVPTDCPWGSPDTPCDVYVHTLRARKCGPNHPLAVCRCRAHDVAFTVYPPGFVPYARRNLLPLPEDTTPSVATVADQAANGQPWPRHMPGGSDRWWTTQTRLLARAISLAGADDLARDMIALAIGVPLAVLDAMRKAVGYRQRGLAVRSFLDSLEPLPLERLLLAGFLAGLWGPAFRWQTLPPRLVPVVPTHLVDLARASTTLGPRGPPSQT
jgi:hypothetical protein